jgi:hypothetical protein
MNVIRSLISVFIVLLLVSVAAGWGWTADHQSGGLATASNVVLGLSAIAGIVGLIVLWKPRRGASGRT